MEALVRPCLREKSEVLEGTTVLALQNGQVFDIREIVEIGEVHPLTGAYNVQLKNGSKYQLLHFVNEDLRQSFPNAVFCQFDHDELINQWHKASRTDQNG